MPSGFVHRVAALGAQALEADTRLRTELGCAIDEQGRIVSESAAHYGVDWSIVHAAFVAHVKAPLAAPLPPVKVLGDR